MLRQHLSGDDWIKAANRLMLRPDLPLTLQGGEPTLHKDFYQIVNEVKPEIQMDLLTNLQFDVEEFIANVPLWRFNREAPYAPIRVSWHQGQNDITEIKGKIRRLERAGFRVGIYTVLVPELFPVEQGVVYDAKQYAESQGFDFRYKEFLGEWNGKTYGTYKYEDAMNGKNRKCSCKPSELLVGPNGGVYRCHSDLYNGRVAIGNILNDKFNTTQLDEFIPCDFYGTCNPCDIKIKTNRFQEYGHTSVEIKDLL